MSTIKKVAELNDKGLDLQAIGRYQTAIKFFDEALQLDPNCFEALYNKGNAFMGLGKYAEACDCLERALNINNSFPQMWGTYANALRLLGQSHKAKQLLETAIAKKLIDSSILLVMGLILTDEHDFVNALKWLDQAAAVDSKDYLIWQNRGNVLKSLERYPAAIDSYTKALALKSNDLQSLRKRGELLLSQGNYKRALVDLKAALDLDAQSAGTLCNVGIAVLFSSDNPEEALSYFDRALQIDPNNSTILKNRQVCLNTIQSRQ